MTAFLQLHVPRPLNHKLTTSH